MTLTDPNEPAHALPSSAVRPGDLRYLRRCIELASTAVDSGDGPFGSVLVDAEGTIRAEERNRETTAGDPTRHPEFELARWAATHLSPQQRSAATVYTTGEHCPMCAAAHAWVRLGRIVYATSAEQARTWRAELGVTSTSPLRALTIRDLAPGLDVSGPAPELIHEVHDLYRRAHAPRSENPATPTSG